MPTPGTGVIFILHWASSESGCRYILVFTAHVATLFQANCYRFWSRQSRSLWRRLISMKYAALILSVLAALGFQGGASPAQDYPTRPIRVITVNGPGGTADIFLRSLGQEIQKRTGQPFVVEPRPGGNFTLGARGCAEAPNDGYTICMLNNEALAYNEFLYKKIPYNPAKDFAPITNLLFITTALVVNSSLQVKTLDELAALAKARPKTLAFVAPSMHQRLLFDRFNKERGIDLVGIPFKGGGDAVTGILSGATPVGFFGLASFLPHLRDGKMTAMGVDSDERSPLVPQVPTLAELGYRDNLSRVYYGLVAPTGMPKPFIDRLQTEIASIMSEHDFRTKLLIDRALEPVANSPEEFARFLEKDRIVSLNNVREGGMAPE
jgi:tripartite-type tricarboxylate transporter receptor subunit TctC